MAPSDLERFDRGGMRKSRLITRGGLHGQNVAVRNSPDVSPDVRTHRRKVDKSMTWESILNRSRSPAEQKLRRRGEGDSGTRVVGRSVESDRRGCFSSHNKCITFGERYGW